MIPTVDNKSIIAFKNVVKTQPPPISDMTWSQGCRTYCVLASFPNPEGKYEPEIGPIRSSDSFGQVLGIPENVNV